MTHDFKTNVLLEEKRPQVLVVSDGEDYTTRDRWRGKRDLVDSLAVEEWFRRRVPLDKLDVDLSTQAGAAAAALYAELYQYHFFDGRIMDCLDLANHLVFGEDWPTYATSPGRHFLSQVNVTSCNGAFLASFLQRRGYEVHVVDNAVTQREFLIDELDNESDLLCAIISTTHVRGYRDLAAHAALIKSHRPELPVIAGGILLRHLPELLRSEIDPAAASVAAHRAAETKAQALTALKNVDYVISEKRGEASLLHLLHCIADKSDVGAVPNLSARSNDGQFHYTFRQEEQNEMALLEPILWNELPFALQPNVTMLTTRGCPFRCSFCVLHDSYPKVLHKPLEVFEREVRSLRHCPDVRGVGLADVEAFVSKKHTHALLDLLAKHNPPGVRWTVSARADSITDEIGRKMRDAGISIVFAGFESGDQGQLDRMNKRMKLDTLRNAVDVLHKYDIGFTSEWVIGFPGETDETLRHTIDLIEFTDSFYNLDMFRFHQALSNIAQSRDEFGLVPLSESPVHWRHETMDNLDAARAVCNVRDSVKTAPIEGSNAFVSSSHLVVAGLSQSEARDYVRSCNRLTDGTMGRSSDDTQHDLDVAKSFAQRMLRNTDAAEYESLYY